MRPLLVLTAAFLLAACAPSEEPQPPREPSMESDEWTILFDGSSLDHFRGFKRDSVPAAWSIQDGTLAFAPAEDRGDLITREQYANFELELEWRISEAGNSGIIYRASEDHDYPWMTGVEYQILDNEKHPDAQYGADRLAGAVYDLYPSDSGAVRPVGEWNKTRILARGNRVEHWLNDRKVGEYELDSEDWDARWEDSKWPDYPAFGTTRTGHIALQDHNDPVWFRNIRIRRL